MATYYKILLETGDALLQEIGDNILLENYFYDEVSIQAKIVIKRTQIKTIQAKAEIHQFVEYFLNTNFKNEVATTADWDTTTDKCRLTEV